MPQQYVHREGSYDTQGAAYAKVRELKAKGYGAKSFKQTYGPHTRPLYTVFRTSEKGTAYPVTRRSRRKFPSIRR